MHKLFSLALLSLTISACSVVAASTGSHEPDFSKLKKGVSEEVVESELGPFIDSKKVNGLTEKVYTYKLGDKPAAGRALGYLVLDVFTLCLAEYILFPMEISNSGNAYDAVVAYDSNNQLYRLTEKVTAQKSK